MEVIKRKPVLAREREARLKMEGCREMVSKLCWRLQWSSATLTYEKTIEKNMEQVSKMNQKTGLAGLVCST